MDEQITKRSPGVRKSFLGDRCRVALSGGSMSGGTFWGIDVGWHFLGDRCRVALSGGSMSGGTFYFRFCILGISH